MFFIKKLIIETAGAISSIEFTPGVNIITGPSNTGKSLVLNCIDYMMGARKHRFDKNFNMQKIQLDLDVDGKLLSISRKIDSTKFDVASNVVDIEDGVYYSSVNAKMSINNLWLKLMNLSENVKILGTKTGKIQALTLRSFCHLICINENCISTEDSILKQPRGIAQGVGIPVIAMLLYFATNTSYLANESVEDKKINNACREAVIKFVDRGIAYLKQHKSTYTCVKLKNTPEELRENINQIVDEIGAAQGILDKTLYLCQQVGDNINQVNIQLSEDEVLIDRNRHLLTQYQSDIKRMTFMAEGDFLTRNSKIRKKCPFCDNEVLIYPHRNIIENLVVESEKIKMKIKDLLSVQETLSKECIELKQKRKKLIDKRSTLEDKIRGEISPQIDTLRSCLNEYQVSLKLAEMNENISCFLGFLQDERKNATPVSTFSQIPDIEAKFNEIFDCCLDKEILELLKTCEYQNFIEARFDFEQYDVVINGRMKKSQGQGFRAYINIIVILAIQNCLYEMNRCNFGFFIVDSPFQSLKEKEDDGIKVTEDMKASLMEYFFKRKMSLQTIIIENQIPTVNYEDANLIHFTKDKNIGRYGLIKEYCD